MQYRWLFLGLCLFHLLLLPSAMAGNGDGNNGNDNDNDNGNGGPRPTPGLDASALASLASAGYMGYQTLKLRKK